MNVNCDTVLTSAIGVDVTVFALEIDRVRLIYGHISKGLFLGFAY